MATMRSSLILGIECNFSTLNALLILLDIINFNYLCFTFYSYFDPY